MKVYVVLFHSVWDTGEDPGEENENGIPEDTSIEGVYARRVDAEASIAGDEVLFPLKRSHNFYTIEEHAITPARARLLGT